MKYDANDAGGPVITAGALKFIKYNSGLNIHEILDRDNRSHARGHFLRSLGRYRKLNASRRLGWGGDSIALRLRMRITDSL
jgi:hypothetical protein